MGSLLALHLGLRILDNDTRFWEMPFLNGILHVLSNTWVTIPIQQRSAEDHSNNPKEQVSKAKEITGSLVLSGINILVTGAINYLIYGEQKLPNPNKLSQLKNGVFASGNSASTYKPLSWLWTACYLLLLLSPLEKGLQTKEGKGEKTKKSMFRENPKRTSNTHLQANAEYLRFEEFELEQRKADPGTKAIEKFVFT